MDLAELIAGILGEYCLLFAAVLEPHVGLRLDTLANAILGLCEGV
jgi:hypothetical protein